MNQWRRDLADDGQAEPYLDCASCELSRDMRAEWGCGWLPESQRTDVFPVPIEWPIEAAVCPGYSTSLPQVFETARASFWVQRRYLVERYEGQALTPQLMDAIEVFDMESSRVESYVMKRKVKGSQ